MRRALTALCLLLAGCVRGGFGVADAKSDVGPVVLSGDARPPDVAAADQAGQPDARSSAPAGMLQREGSGPTFRLIFGMADIGLVTPPVPAFVKELQFDAVGDTIRGGLSIGVKPGPLKAMDVGRDGLLLLAHYLEAPYVLERIEITPGLRASTPLTLTHAADPGRAIEHTHTLCFLPGGTFVVGAGTAADNNHLNEYAPTGALLRGVYTSTFGDKQIPRLISTCISRSDLELYAHEAEIASKNSRMLRFTRPTPDAAWTLTDSVVINDVAATLAADATPSWTFALDQKNDLLYIAPYRPAPGSITRLLRCPARGFSAASCGPVGATLPGVPNVGGSGIKGMAQIPGRDDLLVLNHGAAGVRGARTIYRFEAASGAWKALYNLEQIAGGYAEPQGYPLLL